LQNLSDQAALTYTLKIQSAIVNAPLAGVEWIDDDNEIHRRTGLEARGTIAGGRKLRLLTCYHPNELLPLSSSAHVGHFLTEFGYPSNKLPSLKQPVARLLLLNELFWEAKKHIPGLSPNQMMWAMYDRDFGMSPLIDEADASGADTEAQDISAHNKQASSENGTALPDDVLVDDVDAAELDLNRILTGPPGTGKTYATIAEAVRIIDADFFAENRGNRTELKARFDELVTSKQIHFTTFHQSFSYEDFVEGLRAETDDASNQVNYKIEPGVFQRVCIAANAAAEQTINIPGVALRENPRVWKISIAGSADSRTRRYCLEHGQARIGWGGTGDLRHADLGLPSHNLGSNDKSCLRNFSEDIQIGDILLCLVSNTQICALGVVTSEYFFDETPPPEIEDSSYKHVLKVNWLLRDICFSILALNANKPFALKTVYELSRIKWPELVHALHNEGYSLPSQTPAPALMQSADAKERFVLIIDEINRGNVSRIFGELITLIEPSKRAGCTEALEVILPYSKKPFKVPSNVYLIGTMNSADRSLTGIDIALRRRFQFIEMPPKPQRLEHINIEGIALTPLLEAMNKRIEVLLGRDFCLGHAYFIGLKNSDDLTKLAQIFRYKILPLLQEYFFEDWQRIAWILNDQHKPAEDAFVRQESNNIRAIFGGSDNISAPAMPWSVNPEAFNNVRSYLGIIETQK
jgi:5-methylcytosine-specific restriction protein B